MSGTGGKSNTSQLSQPFIGGSTTGYEVNWRQEQYVAMEPAVYRREHRGHRGHWHSDQGVAMEPAVYRREHTQTCERAGLAFPSQWSPPFIGGSTRGSMAGRDQ